MPLNFETIDYLRAGTEKQQRAHKTLVSHTVLETLQVFNPLLVGTIPLNIDIANSDLDIICQWKSKNLFIETLIENFAHHRDFLLTEKKIGDHETILATFRIDDFEIEIFGQNRPVKEQEAWRHMLIEYSLLLNNSETFRQQIIDLKNVGLTTEEAFAKQLALKGDPYRELLRYGEEQLKL